MAGKTVSLCDSVLNWLLGTAFPAAIATQNVGLLHTNPTDDNNMTSGVETTYTNYARQTIAGSSVGWNAPANGTGTTRVITNKLLLTFPTAGATGDTGINGFTLEKTTSTATAITAAGEVLYWGAIAGAPKVINASDPVSIAAGALTLSED